MEEVWKSIKNYEGLYEISNLGNVKSLNYNNTNKEKILQQRKHKQGYNMVVLCKDGKCKNLLVHRLVAQAFIPNPNNLPCVNHKDENKKNNVVDNLEWCTYQYNNTYGTLQQRRVANTDWMSVGRKNSEKLTNRKDLSKKVYQYNKQCELISIYPSTMECGRNGFNIGAVSSCCNGKRKSHKGYIWSYKPIK